MWWFGCKRGKGRNPHLGGGDQPFRAGIKEVFKTYNLVSFAVDEKDLRNEKKPNPNGGRAKVHVKKKAGLRSKIIKYEY